MRTLLALGALAIALLGVAAASAGVGGGTPPRIADVFYYEDLEDGKRHNIVADVKRDAVVFARADGVESDGRRSRHIGPAGERGFYSYFFREKKFVKHVLADFADNGSARITVFAGTDGGLVRKRCKLVLEPDPVHGDSSSSYCNASR